MAHHIINQIQSFVFFQVVIAAYLQLFFIHLIQQAFIFDNGQWSSFVFYHFNKKIGFSTLLELQHEQQRTENQ